MTEPTMADAFLALERARDTFSGYSAREIENMSMGEFSRLRERAGLPGIEHTASVGAAAPEPAQAQVPARQGAPDFSAMGMSEYARLREQAGIGRSTSARGLFD